MENRKPFGRYLMAFYFFLVLCSFLFLQGRAVWHLIARGKASTIPGCLSVLPDFVLVFLLVFIIIGLCARRSWADLLAKYVYPVFVIPFLGIGSCAIVAFGRTLQPLATFILLSVFIFSILSLFYLLPVVLYFYPVAIRRLPRWLKILLFSPVFIFFGYCFIVGYGFIKMMF